MNGLFLEPLTKNSLISSRTDRSRIETFPGCVSVYTLAPLSEVLWSKSAMMMKIYTKNCCCFFKTFVVPMRSFPKGNSGPAT